MKNTIYQRIGRNSGMLVLTIIFTLFTTTRCTKDETPAPKPAPELPPTYTMAMNFSDFSDVDTNTYKSTYSYNNWGWAAGNVLVWNAVLTVTLVVPVASFYEAFNHEAVYDPDSDSWTWSYNFMAGGAVHLAELHASLVTEGVKWDMYISKNNAFSHFLWYTGISNYQNAEGYWMMYNNPADPKEFLRIDWERDIPNNTAQIKYTNIIPDNEGYGSYIFYGHSGDPMDAFYDIYKSNLNDTINIQWSRTDKYGRVKDPLHFGDTDWRCWDEMLMNTDCQ